eukprot:2543191-Prymnesium_polylepis.1
MMMVVGSAADGGGGAMGGDPARGASWKDKEDSSAIITRAAVGCPRAGRAATYPRCICGDRVGLAQEKTQSILRSDPEAKAAVRPCVSVQEVADYRRPIPAKHHEVAPVDSLWAPCPAEYQPPVVTKAPLVGKYHPHDELWYRSWVVELNPVLTRAHVSGVPSVSDLGDDDWCYKVCMARRTVMQDGKSACAVRTGPAVCGREACSAAVGGHVHGCTLGGACVK